MVVVLQFMDRQGEVIEWFLGLVHVVETRDVRLMKAFVSIFSMHGLSISRLRGQDMMVLQICDMNSTA